MTGKNYGRINSIEELSKFTARLIADSKPIGVDLETGYAGEPRDKAALHPEEGFIVGISFSNDPKWARYIPLEHEGASNLDAPEVAELMWPLLTTGLGVAHNAKFELRFLSTFFVQHLSEHPEYGEAVRASNGYFPILSDTMIEAYVDASEKRSGLKYLTKEVLGHDQAEITSLFEKTPKTRMGALRFNTLALTEEVIAYACEDAAWCLALHRVFYPKVKDKFIYKVDMKIIPILARMEDVGVAYDWEAMRTARSDLTRFIELLETEMREDISKATGEEIISMNFGSPPQVGDLLYNKLKLPSILKTEKGAPSTSEKALTGLAKKHPIVQRILDWRNLKVLLSRYLEKFESDYRYADDGNAHPSHAQTLVPSGRFAHSEPNYAQTPSRYHQELRSGETFDCMFRDFLVAPPNTYMFGFDYSQIELRMTAGISKESNMLEAFDAGIDIHTATAAAMFGVAPDKVEKEQRQQGKLINFALLYGQGVKSTAEVLGISKADAQELYNRYFAGFPQLKAWTDKVVEKGKAQGSVETIFGRKVVIWDFESTDSWIYAKGERLCVNATVQGSAADYMRLAMIRVSEWLDENDLRDKVRLVMNIHDALEFYVDKDIDPHWLAEQMRPIVTFPIKGFPEMRADFHLGSSWGQLKELDSVEVQPQAEAVEIAPEPVVEAPEPIEAPRASEEFAEADIVEVHVDHIPYADEFAAFKELLAHLDEGPTLVRSVFEKQAPVDSSKRYRINDSFASQAKMIFGGCRITQTIESVDSSALLAGLEL
jgi:DNA polymerase-1